MKRFLILVLVLGIFAGSVATAEAKGKKQRSRVERTVEATYGPYPAPVTGCNELLGPWACAEVPTRTNEISFTAKVTDAHGQPVFVEAWVGNRRVVFCGETKEPISFPAGSTIYFHVGLPDWPPLVNPSISADCPANRIKTTGTISVTLSNLP